MISKPDFKEIEAVGEYLQEVPYDVTRATLYTASDLYDAYDASDAQASMQRCYDARVYKHYIDTGKFTSCAKEKLARTLRPLHRGGARPICGRARRDAHSGRDGRPRSFAQR